MSIKTQAELQHILAHLSDEDIKRLSEMGETEINERRRKAAARAEAKRQQEQAKINTRAFNIFTNLSHERRKAIKAIRNITTTPEAVDVCRILGGMKEEDNKVVARVYILVIESEAIRPYLPREGKKYS